MPVDNTAELPEWFGGPRRLSLEEQARRQGVLPIDSVDDLVEPGMFDSDEELGDFLEDLRASRSAGLE